MRILITGITGRIGTNLVAALVQAGHSVRGLVWPRDPRVEKLRPLGVELQSGSLTEAEAALRAVEGMEVVYHLGGAFQGGGPFTVLVCSLQGARRGAVPGILAHLWPAGHHPALLPRRRRGGDPGVSPLLLQPAAQRPPGPRRAAGSGRTAGGSVSFPLCHRW